MTTFKQKADEPFSHGGSRMVCTILMRCETATESLSVNSVTCSSSFRSEFGPVTPSLQ